MPGYVDGFVVPVPRKKLKAYVALARKGARVWMEHGALEYREAVADDMQAKGAVSFPRSVRLARGETVFFSWIVYKSRAHRDRVMAKVMKDPRLAKMMAPGTPQPFDFKRMLYAGFKVVVDR